MRHVLEDFEGYVIEEDTDNGRDTFWIRFIDQDEEEMEGAVFKDKIPTSEHKYIQPGAYFHWTIYNDGTYDFKFSREVWTQEMIDKATKDAEELAKYFKLAKQLPEAE